MWSFDDWWVGYLVWVNAGPKGPPMDSAWAREHVQPGTARGEGTFGLMHKKYWQEQREVPDSLPPVQVDPDFGIPGYQQLERVLREAYRQAAIGKGKERHANELPFHEQPMQQIAARRGIGFILGQADKKSEEAQGMLERGERDKAVHELLGAIVYLAGAVIHIRKQEQ